ncbi:hypothetical protein PsorP6_013953 [Peronosclerospora sorghi]|uniref:Uncharacterized protein n=1 Tax=Peronosclerospora sorghi TaxID=230839 RepID=A0ACC0VIN5_9STRA|nr:hypothetical protein PsorP6_013953 [Peronosclerospora sorghi]
MEVVTEEIHISLRSLSCVGTAVLWHENSALYYPRSQPSVSLRQIAEEKRAIDVSIPDEPPCGHCRSHWRKWSVGKHCIPPNTTPS